MFQPNLFDPSKCGEKGNIFKEILLKKIGPGYVQGDEAEKLRVGGFAEALSLVGDDESHSAFQYLKGTVRKMGRSPDQEISLIPAYRFATNPKTAGKVAHLPSLTQVQGYINQLALGGDADEGPLMPKAPNRLAGRIDFGNLQQGETLAPHVAGQIGEDSVGSVLKRLDIQFSSQFPSTIVGWGKKDPLRPDFKVAAFDADPLKQGFYIEVKWRNRQTSVDDALVALLHNVESFYDLPVLILYDGVGATRRTYEMVRHQMEMKRRRLDGKLLSLMTFSEFVLFAQTQLGFQRRRVAA